MNAKVRHIEQRACPHCNNLDSLFDRVRRIELILALMLGASTASGLGIAKLLGAF